MTALQEPESEPTRRPEGRDSARRAGLKSAHERLDGYIQSLNDAGGKVRQPQLCLK